MLFSVSLMLVSAASSADALIAVASNFMDAAKALETDFESQSHHDLTLTFGSTGSLYAQIVNGAPYDALLAADQRRPFRLERSRHAVADSRFVYAIGRLSLWSADENRISTDGVSALTDRDFRKLAVANPQLAPYGTAAMQVLSKLGLLDELESRLVYGENVGQAHTFVATGNAELGFVASSAVSGGSRWDIPQHMHGAIEQQAVLLSHGQTNAAAMAFLSYLQTGQARETIRAHGYVVD